MEEVSPEQVKAIYDDLSQPPVQSEEPASVPQIKCLVMKPQKVGEGINAYVSYTISFQYPGGDNKTFTRRYSDFDWLHDSLKLDFPQYIIPPLPEKVLFDRFTSENVEYRRKELERFLNRVMNHPAFPSSNHIKTFMTATETYMEGERLKPRSAVPGPIQKKEDEPKGLFELVGKFSSTITSVVTRPSVELKEVDPWFDKQRAYVSNVEQHLQVLVDRSNQNTKKKSEMVSTLEDLAQSASLACGAEIDIDPELAKYWSKLSEIMGQMSLLTKELAQSETESFEYQVKDYVRLSTAAKQLLENRQAALLRLQVAQADVTVKTEKQEKGKNTSKASALNADLKEATNSLEVSNSEYNVINESAKKELNTYKDNKSAQVKEAFKDLVTINLNYQLRMANLWKELLVDLK
uniref:PX domain-containing protein n=1 Tax=Arcella intermedia TaxID=1963864 RepID=A0A6B2L5X0_9EUKA